MAYAHAEDRREYNRQYRLRNLEALREYDRSPGRKERVRKYQEARYQETRGTVEGYVTRTYNSAKVRAKKLGIPFSITKADIIVPEVCPILGIDIIPGTGCSSPNSPSLDKVIPALGYVPGNVRVISQQANRLKQDNTVETLEAILKYIREHTSKEKQ